MNQETKRQHYVPQAYLRKFGYQRKKDQFQVFLADKGRLNKPFPVNTSKICIQTDLYSLTGETEEERQAIEKFYDFEIETNYDRIYKILTDDSIRVIDDETKEAIVLTMITLLFRVTNWISSFNLFVNRIFTDRFATAKQMEKKYFYFEGKKIEISKKNVKELIVEYEKKTREGQVVTQLVAALRLSKIRMKGNLGIVKVEHSSNFITSDNPVNLSRLGGGHVMPFDPDNLISLPLNEKYKLTLYSNFDKERPNFISRILHKGEMADREILMNNFEQYQQAEKFIIGNKKELTTFEDFLKRCKQPIEPSEELKKRLEKMEDLAKKLGLE
ncbi:DUF4238 domain-containing protein [Reichenbachiella sp. MALMAid0571]|uniref:DUF4238 domain-containing protein n=1 Tax=Reichenbachiella sp. MALMAid0571 TaxID=3143939 RepID=UPI0032E0011F